MFRHKSYSALIGVSFLFALISSGCGALFCFEVSGPITQWSYHISPFSKIRVYNSPQIYITQGDSQSVVVESEENMFHALLFHIDPFGERLYIDFDETCIEGIDHFKIFITVDTLKEIDLRGGGEVWVEDTMVTDSLRVLIAGNAHANLESVRATAIYTNISGSGEVRYTGLDTVSNHFIEIDGIGSVFSYGLASKNVSVDVSGGAFIQTTAYDTLNVLVSGTAEIHYRGYPQIQQNITGNGQIIDAN